MARGNEMEKYRIGQRVQAIKWEFAGEEGTVSVDPDTGEYQDEEEDLVYVVWDNPEGYEGLKPGWQWGEYLKAIT
jgi:hypothetical protein